LKSRKAATAQRPTLPHDGRLRAGLAHVDPHRQRAGHGPAGRRPAPGRGLRAPDPSPIQHMALSAPRELRGARRRVGQYKGQQSAVGPRR